MTMWIITCLATSWLSGPLHCLRRRLFDTQPVLLNDRGPLHLTIFVLDWNGGKLHRRRFRNSQFVLDSRVRRSSGTDLLLKPSSPKISPNERWEEAKNENEKYRSLFSGYLRKEESKRTRHLISRGDFRLVGLKPNRTWDRRVGMIQHQHLMVGGQHSKGLRCWSKDETL